MRCDAVQWHWAYFHVTGMFVQAACGINGNAALPHCHLPKIKACGGKCSKGESSKKNLLTQSDQHQFYRQRVSVLSFANSICAFFFGMYL